MHARSIALGLVAGALTGCPSLGRFQCVDDADCDRGAAGQCHAGDCAYEDPACPITGLRFSEHARDAAGQCVPGSTGDTEAGDASSGDGGGATASTADDGAASTGQATTGAPSCGMRKQLRLDTSLLSPSRSFPGYAALVVLQDADLLAADPEAIFFTDTDDAVLPSEIDAFDADTGALAAWVRLSGWEPGAPLTIALRLGDLASAPDPMVAAVWQDNYVGVWHLGDVLDEQRGEVIRDSTSAANHGFAMGGMSGDAMTTGIIGGALLFDGNDDEIEMEAAFVGTLESFTISLWMRVDGDDSTHHPLFQRLNGDPLYPRCRRLIGTSGGDVMCQTGVGAETATLSAQASDTPDGEARLVALTYDAELGTARLYISGEEVSNTSVTPGPADGGDAQFGLGRIDEFGSMLGMLDEVRVSSRALPPEWLAADYRNQQTPSNLLLEVGAAEPAPCR